MNENAKRALVTFRRKANRAAEVASETLEDLEKRDGLERVQESGVLLALERVALELEGLAKEARAALRRQETEGRQLGLVLEAAGGKR